MLNRTSRKNNRDTTAVIEKKYDLEVAKNILRVRFGQIIINEKYKKGEFRIPIHLALGHEAIAVSVDAIMEEDDRLMLSHRNIHYNLARSKSLKPEIDEYLLKDKGLNKGQSGSMNLANKERGIVYASSILGNNLPVAAGLALGQKVKHSKGLVIVVTGDGAIEEGSFYESLLFLKSNDLISMIIIENNGWSLATRINERRCSIDLRKFTDSLSIRYEKLVSNNACEYIDSLKEIRKYAVLNKTPVCIEVELSTLGHWHLKNDEYPDGKFINYHAGPAPAVHLTDWPLLDDSERDPLFILKQYFDEYSLKEISSELLHSLMGDLDELC